MGTKGPAPKRVAERLGHLTKAQKSGVSAVTMRGAVKVPGLPKGTHSVARRWYAALKASGQATYFEPSDWAAALYVAAAMTRNLETDRFSAGLFASVWGAMDDLLTTEGARRRARIEVSRAVEDDSAKPTTIADYKKALGYKQ